MEIPGHESKMSSQETNHISDSPSNIKPNKIQLLGAKPPVLCLKVETVVIKRNLRVGARLER
jgi:hypothetical protein